MLKYREIPRSADRSKGFVLKNLPSKNLFVYTNSRALRAALQSESGGVLAPRITLAEFYEKALFVPDLVACGEIDRALFMKQAVSESKRAGERLKFPSELYEFMRNREYLFGFFKELATERVSIDALDLSDTYAWYAEHFEILRELAGAYARILREHGFYDEITLPALYELNESYLRGFERIEINIDGNPSAFEFEVFKRAAELSEVVLSFRATTLNSKPVRAVEELCGISLELGFAYRVNLGTGEILSREPLSMGGAVVCRGFELRSLQASYVFEKISSFVHEPEHQEFGPFAFAACRKRFDHRGGEGGEPTEQTGGDGGTPEDDGSGGTVVNIKRVRVGDRHNQQPVEE